MRAKPVYISEADKEHERNFAKKIEEAYKGKHVRVAHLGALYRLDWMLYFDNREGARAGSKKAFAVAELKCRRINHDKYDTVIISLDKWDAGLLYTQHFNLSFIIFFQFEDGNYYYRVKDEGEELLDIQIGGRTRNPKHGDYPEPVVHIPSEYLQELRSDD